MTPIVNIDTARFINIATFEWPVSFLAIQRANPSVFWGANVTTEDILALGYAEIKPRDHEVGDVVREIDPEFINGEFFQRWEVRGFNPEELEANLQAAKNSLRTKVIGLKNDTLAKGYPYQFDSGIYHVQMRDTDRTNILGMTEIAQRDPQGTQVFRVYENQNIPLTAEKLSSMTDAIGVAYSQLMAKVWEFKDQIEAATTKEQLPVIPSTLAEFYADHLLWPAPAS